MIPNMLTSMAVAMLLIAGACTSAATGQSAQTAAGSPTTGPAALTKDSSIDELLDALDRAGTDLQSLKATVVLNDIDDVTGDSTSRPGEVLLQRDGEVVKFRAVFKGVIVELPNGKTGLREERKEYVLRDGELIDRNYKTRTEVRRKLPPQEGKRDLLKLGEGPFPLPIGQRAEDVHRQFAVVEVDPADEEQNMFGVEAAPNTRRLRLTPKPGTPLAKSFSWIEIDVSLEDGMPRKVITLNPEGNAARVTDFVRKPEVNKPIPADAFDLEPVDRGQWDVIIEELETPEAPPAAQPAGAGDQDLLGSFDHVSPTR